MFGIQRLTEYFYVNFVNSNMFIKNLLFARITCLIAWKL